MQLLDKIDTVFTAALILINVCTSAADNRLCYSANAIKGRVQLEIICLQTDQSKVMRFFSVVVGLLD